MKIERIKTLDNGVFILTHDRFIDENGFLVDSFDFIEEAWGKKIHTPFMPIIKVKDYTDKTNIMDCTANYTDKEYQQMFNEQLGKIKRSNKS